MNKDPMSMYFMQKEEEIPTSPSTGHPTQEQLIGAIKEIFPENLAGGFVCFVSKEPDETGLMVLHFRSIIGGDNRTVYEISNYMNARIKKYFAKNIEGDITP